MNIEVLDPVWSRFSPKADIDKILPCLTYQVEQYAIGPTERSMIHHGNGRLLTGLIPRVKKYCERMGFPLTVNGEFLYPAEKNIPFLPGFTFREDQVKTIKSVIEKERGVIQNATGTGKTVIAGAICSIWPSSHIIFLCHTLDLLQQAKKAFTEEFGFKNVISLGGGEKDFDWPKEPTIVVSTIQTLRRFQLIDHCEWADIIIVDECHHLASKNSMIAEILKQSLAPIRIGLSAELPKTDKGRMILEGYLGPVIGEFTYQEGVAAGVLAKPLFNLIPVPYSEEIGNTNHYHNRTDENGNLIKGIYQKGIIENKSRNRLALLEAMKSINDGESVLILTSRDTQHGHIISKMAKDIFDIDIPFIYGDTEKEIRQEMKDALERKEIKCIISNVIWKEGINIKSLNHVINIGGEKSPTQIVGRGSRTTDTKKWVKIVDFLDPYKFLNNHTVQRLICYAEQGWLNYHDLKKGE